MATFAGKQDTAAVTHGVADVPRDMTSIFGVPEGPPARAGAKRADPVTAFMRGEAPERRRWPLMLLLAALSLAIAGGVAWAAWRGDLAGTTRLLHATAGPNQSLAQDRAPPQPVTVALTGRPIADDLVIAHSLVAAAPVATEAGASSPIAKPARVAGRPKIGAKPRPIAARDPDETGCAPSGGETPASCRASELAPELALADQQLRLALARAAGARMNPKLLTMFQKRWWQVRQEVESDPAYVTAAYRQLAREIDAARLSG